MRWNWKYASITIVLFLIEVCIALFVNDKFIRPFLGDVLVVILLYAGCRTVLKASACKVVIGVLLFAFGIELLQFFNLVELLGWQDIKLARIIIGSTFDWLDLLAYTIGATVVLFAERFFRKNSSRKD